VFLAAKGGWNKRNWIDQREKVEGERRIKSFGPIGEKSWFFLDKKGKNYRKRPLLPNDEKRKGKLLQKDVIVGGGKMKRAKKGSVSLKGKKKGGG